MKKIIISIISLMLVFALVGCKKDSPEATIDGFSKAIKAFDFEEMTKYMAGDVDSSMIEEDEASKILMDYLKDAAKKITYKISNVEVDGDTATATVVYNHIDGSGIMEYTIDEYIRIALEADSQGREPTEAQYMDMFYEAFDKAIDQVETPMMDTTVTMHLVKEDSAWKINTTEESYNLSNVMMANMADSINFFE